MRNTLSTVLAISAMAFATFAPSLAHGRVLEPQSAAIKHREKMKNEWKTIAIGSGVLGAIGLLNKDGTLTFLGTAGALYSAHRYEQDRKSENKLRRARAATFSKAYIYRNGKKYVRRTVYKGGKKYYQFVCMKH
ncbi:MAG: hypothetical protein HZC36_06680 [Armatimonadetes bacterium]|nr:hypothetical protein [Armatimonadota bacterium]